MEFDFGVYLVDLFGIAVFAISGALLAAKLKMDITSFILLGMVAGVGGGTLRDMLLGRTPVYWIEDPTYFILCTFVSISTFFIAHWLNRFTKLLLWFDALGMAVFCVTGTEISLAFGTSYSVAMLMGVMSSCFGGLFRDVAAQVPSILFQKNIYMTAAVLGSGSFIIFADVLLIDRNFSLILAVTLAFGLRALAIIYDLRLPSYQWLDHK